MGTTYHGEGIAIPGAYKKPIEHLVPILFQQSAQNHDECWYSGPCTYSPLQGDETGFCYIHPKFPAVMEPNRLRPDTEHTPTVQ